MLFFFTTTRTNHAQNAGNERDFKIFFASGGAAQAAGAKLVSRVFARIFVIISVLAISEEFSKFWVKILSSPILAERGGRANP